MRRSAHVLGLVAIASTTAFADEPESAPTAETSEARATSAMSATSTIRTWRLGEPRNEGDNEPLLHIDAVAPLPALAEGGIVDGQRAALELGPHMRLAAEGTWWQTGLAPSMFATDLPDNGWRAAAELSYDLGPFRVGVNASMTRAGDSSHRMVGLFAYRTFRLSRWMRAWIVLGLAYEEWSFAGAHAPRRGTAAGLSIGTTFR